jgi:hypothetical protein
MHTYYLGQSGLLSVFCGVAQQSAPVRDLTNPRHMLLKAAMFAVIGATSAGLLFLENPSRRTQAEGLKQASPGQARDERRPGKAAQTRVSPNEA